MSKRKYTIIAVLTILFAFASISNFSSKVKNDKRIYYINELEQSIIDQVKDCVEFDFNDYILVHMYTIKDDIRYVYRVDNGVRKEVEDLYYNFEGHSERTSDTLVFLRKKTEEVKLIYISNDEVVVITSIGMFDDWKRDKIVYNMKN